MENNNSIMIGYSSKAHESLISDFRKGLPNEIKVEPYLQDRFFTADAMEFYPIVICFTGWLLSNTGAYYYNLLLDKTREFIKGHVKLETKNASFQMVFGYGENSKSFKVDNVGEDSAMRAFDEFIKIVTTQKKIDSDNTFNSETQEFD